MAVHFVLRIIAFFLFADYVRSSIGSNHKALVLLHKTRTFVDGTESDFVLHDMSLQVSYKIGTQYIHLTFRAGFSAIFIFGNMNIFGPIGYPVLVTFVIITPIPVSGVTALFAPRAPSNILGSKTEDQVRQHIIECSLEEQLTIWNLTRYSWGCFLGLVAAF